MPIRPIEHRDAAAWGRCARMPVPNEGWFVEEPARQRGHTELASDTEIENEGSL
jgi:hypothetical protein